MGSVVAFQTVSLRNLTNWSVRYLLDVSFDYNEDYDLFPIGDFLERNRNTIVVQDEIKYNRVTVKVNNNGVTLRNIEIGKNIGTKKQYKVSAGQFILSKIDARNGAMGLIPIELDGAIVTNDFPTFNLDTQKINPEFLVLVTTTKQFIKFAQSCSSGTTNRQRIDLNLFSSIKIPLPSLQEQNRIVVNYNAKIQLAEQQEAQAEGLEEEIERYLLEELGLSKFGKQETSKGLKVFNYSKLRNWSLSKIFKQSKFDIQSGKFKAEPLGNLLLYLKGGKTPSKQRKDYWNGQISWTSPKDFTNMYISNSDDSISDIALKETNIEVFPKGTILSVFRSGILRHSFPTALTTIDTAINQDVKAYKFNTEVIHDLYYLYFVNVFKSYIIFYASKKGVTVESINTKNFLDLLIPIPPINTQKKIAAHITKLKNQIESLRLQAKINRDTAVSKFEDEIFSKKL